VNFEWDEGKNRENIRKHGLDFEDAWKIFARKQRRNARHFPAEGTKT